MLLTAEHQEIDNHRKWTAWRRGPTSPQVVVCGERGVHICDSPLYSNIVGAVNWRRPYTVERVWIPRSWRGSASQDEAHLLSSVWGRIRRRAVWGIDSVAAERRLVHFPSPTFCSRTWEGMIAVTPYYSATYKVVVLRRNGRNEVRVSGPPIPASYLTNRREGETTIHPNVSDGGVLCGTTALALCNDSDVALALALGVLSGASQDGIFDNPYFHMCDPALQPSETINLATNPAAVTLSAVAEGRRNGETTNENTSETPETASVPAGEEPVSADGGASTPAF